MSGSYTTSSNTVVSFLPTPVDKTISGNVTIDAYGAVGTYNVAGQTGATLDAAVFGHSGTVFTINNAGLIETFNTVDNILDVGIGLGSPGTIINTGSIIGASGIGMLGTVGEQGGYVDNTGLISGSVGVGIYMSAGSVTNAGSISGPQNGVEIIAAGSSIDNTSTGVILSGTGTGVGLDGGGYVTNLGLISAYQEGVTNGGSGSGNVTLHNSRTIQQTGTSTSNSSYAGIYLENPGQIFNSLSGSISGLSGIRIGTGTSGYVDNAGSIHAGHRDGVYFQFGGTVINTGSITAAHHAIVAEGDSGIGFTSIVNSGLLKATANTFTNDSGSTVDGSAIAVLAGGDITNTSQGRIIGALGLYLTGGSLGNAIYLENQGLIHGTFSTGVIIETAGSIDNAGTIAGTANGISADGTGATLTNAAGATISGTNQGVYAAGLDTISNSGLIRTTGLAGMNDGITLGTLGAGTLLNSGTISGYGAGVYAESGGFISNSSTGTIQASGSASTDNGLVFGTANSGAIVNSGTIEDTNGSGVFLRAEIGVQNFGLISGEDFGILATNSDSISNYGTIKSTGVVQFSDFGSLNTPVALKMLGGSATNESGGLITAQDGGVYVGGNGLFTNAGKINGSIAAYIASGATLDNLAGGDLTALGHDVVGEGFGITLVNAGSIGGGPIGAVVTLEAGGTVINSGTIAGFTDAIDFGTGSSELILDPGQVISGGVTAQNSFETGLDLASGSSAGTFNMGGTVTGFGAITFEDGSTWTLEGSVSELIGLPGPQITGFTLGDSLVIENFSGSITGFSGGGLIVSNNIITEDVNFQGTSLTASDFEATTLAGNTTITMLCYLRGTRIRTPSGEVPVEDLRAGDLVETCFAGAQPVKWIGLQSYDSRFLAKNPEKRPVCIHPGALGEALPAHKLFVSPGHAIMVGDALVLAKNLVNGITVTQDDLPGLVDYFAIELLAHDCVIANGAYGESFADGPGLRNQFHNVADFYARFPDYVEPEAIPLCLPRPEEGALLDLALRTVVARAAARTKPGPLHGSIDIATPDGVEGWAQDFSHPHLPVLLEIFAGGKKLGEALACDYRADLAAAGIGRGYAKFSFRAPAGFDPATLRVRRAADGAEIFVSDECRERQYA